MTNILYVDSQDYHEKERNSIAITPFHLNLVDSFSKEVFDKIIENAKKMNLLTA